MPASRADAALAKCHGQAARAARGKLARPRNPARSRKSIVLELCEEVLEHEKGPLHTTRLHGYVKERLPSIRYAEVSDALRDCKRFIKTKPSTWGLAKWDAARLTGLQHMGRAKSPRRSQPAQPPRPTMAELCLGVLDREKRLMHLNGVHECVTALRPGISRASVCACLCNDARFKRAAPNIWGVATWGGACLADFSHPSCTRQVVAQFCLEVLEREKRPLHLGSLHEGVRQLRPKTSRLSIPAALRKDARFKKVARHVWGLAAWDAARLADFTRPARAKITKRKTVAQLCHDVLEGEKRPLHQGRLHEYVRRFRPGARLTSIKGALGKDARFKKVARAIWGLAAWDARRLADFTRPALPPRKRAVPTVAQLCQDALEREKRPLHHKELYEYVRQLRPGIGFTSISGSANTDARFKKVARGIWGLATWDAGRLANYARPPRARSAGRKPTVLQLCQDVLAREERPLHLDRLHEGVTQLRPGIKYGSVSVCVRQDARFKRVGRNIWGLAEKPGVM